MGPATKLFFLVVVVFVTVGIRHTDGREICERYSDVKFSFCDEGSCCGSGDGVTTLPSCCTSSVCLNGSCASYGVIAGIVIGCLVGLGIIVLIIVCCVSKCCTNSAVGTG